MAVAMLLRPYLRGRFCCDGDDNYGDESDDDGISVDNGGEDDDINHFRTWCCTTSQHIGARPAGTSPPCSRTFIR